MLINTITKICDRLSTGGWGDLMLHHGLDITAPDLATELTRELPNIDRTLPGFEDFAFEGRRGIEPGNQAIAAMETVFDSIANDYF